MSFYYVISWKNWLRDLLRFLKSGCFHFKKSSKNFASCKVFATFASILIKANINQGL